jgi:hypothetical protein
VAQSSTEQHAGAQVAYDLAVLKVISYWLFEVARSEPIALNGSSRTKSNNGIPRRSGHGHPA